jgi:cell division protease FtsH
VLEDNVDILHKLADLLLEKETVMGTELNDLIIAMRPGIRLPSYHPADEGDAGEGGIDDRPAEQPDEAGTLKEKVAPDADAAGTTEEKDRGAAEDGPSPE